MDPAAVKCPKCNGTGRVADPRVIGAKWRRSREDRGISLRELARRMRLSATYVSDLERGNKPWPHDMPMRFLAALKA